MAAYPSKEAMERTLSKSFELMSTDKAFQEGTVKTHLSIGFEIEDLDLTFVLRFEQGHMTCEMGASPEGTDFQLSLSSDVYDRMFSGKLNPVQAALFGQLGFSGNVPAAMSLQSHLPQMIRIYRQAKTAQAGPRP